MTLTMLMILVAGAVSVESTLRDRRTEYRMNTREENQERDAERTADGLVERHRCYWRSRRGLLELDLLLPPFVKARFDSLSGAQVSALQRLLDCEDQDIWDWFQRRATPGDAELVAIVDLVRAFNDGHANDR